MFSTTIMTLSSGHERRNINWSKARAMYEVIHGIKSQADMDEIRAFYFARYGRAYSFRFKDHADYQTGMTLIGVGDGVFQLNPGTQQPIPGTYDGTKEFQLVKQYQSGQWAYSREITKPIPGTLTNLTVNGVLFSEGGAGDSGFTVDWSTGKITFNRAPDAGFEIWVGNCEFDVHARFDVDHLNATHDFWLYQSVSSIPVVEVKED